MNLFVLSVPSDQEEIVQRYYTAAFATTDSGRISVRTTPWLSGDTLFLGMGIINGVGPKLAKWDPLRSTKMSNEICFHATY